MAAVGGGAAEMVGDEGVVETSVVERKVAETPPFFAGPSLMGTGAACKSTRSSCMSLTMAIWSCRRVRTGASRAGMSETAGGTERPVMTTEVGASTRWLRTALVVPRFGGGVPEG